MDKVKVEIDIQKMPGQSWLYTYQEREVVLEVKRISVILLVLLLFSTIGNAANAEVVYNGSEEINTIGNQEVDNQEVNNQEIEAPYDENLEADTDLYYYGSPYTDTVNAVFDRLNGRVFEKSANPIPGGFEGSTNEGQVNQAGSSQGDPSQSSQGGTSNQGGVSGPAEKEYTVPGIEYDYDSTILERMQRDGKASTGNVTGTVDSIGTTIHHTVLQFVIGIAPILLIIAIGLMLFSSARAAGFLLMCGVAIFVVLFAPELAKIFINFISGIFY